ncbi:MAG: CHAP domain-containing protein [Candidatus Dormibacteria bacterium]
MTTTSTVAGAADTSGALLAQREALQQQVAGLGGTRSQELAQLLEAENALNNLRAELGHNAAVLADLGRQQDALKARITTTTQQVDSQRRLLAAMSRDQYKQMSHDGEVALVFESSSFGQFISRAMNASRMTRQVADAAAKLKLEEGTLRQASGELRKRHDQAQQLEAQLEQENARELALVADHDSRLSALDANSRSLLGQISRVNQAIAAAATPPPRFTPQSSAPVGGGGSCGNHFDYGYCTWYVAGRRCIPWFGNADEWYTNARSYGYPEGSQARPGAVAVWGPGNGYGSVGHVAYVESVQANGFTVSEYNYTNGWNHYDTRFVAYGKTGPLYGFIYAK